MIEAMPEGSAVLGYERHPAPPYVVREPGRVAVVMSPTPRRLATAILAIDAVAWLVFSGLVTWGMTELRRGPIVAATPVMKALFVAWACLPVLLGILLAALAHWWLTTSRVPPVLEITDDTLTFSFAGWWKTKVRSARLSEVREARCFLTPLFAGQWVVRVRVRVAGRRRPLRGAFFCGNYAVAVQAQELVNAVFACRDGEKE